MAKATGPVFVGLQVRDLEAARRFYVERLGLEPDPQSPPSTVLFSGGPIPFLVREPVDDLDEADRLGLGVTLWLGCDDADELWASLETEGAEIAEKPYDGRFGRTFSLVDPDGYAITVVADEQV